MLAVVSWTERRQLTDQDGIQVRRIGPSSRLAWFVYRHTSTLAPVETAEAGRAGAAGGLARVATRTWMLLRPLARPLMRWAATLFYYAQGIAFVIRERPDVIHCNDYNTMWIGVAARVLRGSVLIYDSHELWPDRNLRPEPRWWLIACEWLFVRAAHRVITASPAYSSEMARRYRIPVPPAVCNVPELSDGERQGLPSPAGADRAVPAVAAYVGGLLRNRGIEQSVRALTEVEAARLRLIGPATPSFRAELELLIDSLGVEDRVEFVAPVPSGEVIRTLSAADLGLCLVQPVCLSYRLTMPNKLFEYVLAGLPVLGSDFPMIGGFIRQHGLGLTVDPEDVAAIASGLRRMLDPEENAIFREAAGRARRTIDWARERATLVRVYRDALPLGGAAPEPA